MNAFMLQGTHGLTGPTASYQLFADVLKSCASILDANLGKAVHSHVIKQGHTTCKFISKALLNMYAKCQALKDCQKLFDEINGQDTVTWNILLSGFAGSKIHDYKVLGLFNMLLSAQDPKPSPISLAIVLPVCTRSGTLGAGTSMHSYAIKSGMDSQTLVGNALVSMYAKSGFVKDASSVFCGITEKDVVSYNALIAGLSENKLVDDAVNAFYQMSKGPIMPNYATIANILPIFASMEDTGGHKLGKETHCYVLRRTEMEEEITVVNALLSFYLRSWRIREAQSLFQRMKSRDLVSWNSIIAGYASNGELFAALQMFRELIDLKMIQPDSVTLMSVLPVCAQLCDLLLGKEIHGYVLRHPALFEDTSVGNALINFYAKCGSAEAAFRTFLFIFQKDLISWNTMLDAFGRNLLQTQFVDLLHWMSVDGTKADSVTVLTVVNFCSTLSRIRNIKETHGFALRSGILHGNNEPTLDNALLDAYGKCGNMDYALKIFDNLSRRRNVVSCNSMISGYFSLGSPDDANMIFHRMSEKDLTTWNFMARGYAQNECPSEALNIFRELQDCGMKPDSMTIMSILPVCGQIASVHFLRQCHACTIRACFEDVYLNAALIDMYSKCGSISSAHNLYLSTHKDLVVFTAMLGGYAMHGMGEEAIQIFHYMLDCGVKPDHVVITAVLSACRHAGLITEGVEIFNSIEHVYHMKPTMEQYACVVDLLGRGGRIKEAFYFLNHMPVAANANVWGTLLGACKTHQDVDMGNLVKDRILKDEIGDIGNYVLLSNLYAADSKWEGVLEMRRHIDSRDLKKPAGCSWIEVGRSKNVFIAGDHSHPTSDLIHSMLNNLDKQIKELHESPHL